ncbi:M24 family metallopeptidase [Methanofollis fontis]|uniref:Peptidase M24 n=1 Tax=Methanofollis fontis TaxID=2052832 RepID=A0A483CQE3_9EURY|nr:Xaa-Pro peptidase family protein [Methanofollis fontis]TAJ43371.1 peptidase M24 [Methanofollis fontis]
MVARVPSAELADRMERFRARMERENPDWELAVIFGKINLYYFTGTMQDGMLLIPRDGDTVFWVRRSIERAFDESNFEDIRPMRSFLDAAEGWGAVPDTVYMETELVSLALLERFRKHFPCTDIRSVHHPVMGVREVKSPYELALMERSGEIHRHVLEDLVPEILREGMSEAGFAAELYAVMVREGHHGIARFGMFDTEITIGQIGFGENSLYPTSFDGPGGCAGMGPAVPTPGSHERRLRKGDLVFVDVGCGVEGYHTDKTMTYQFGAPLPADAVEAHERCVEIQDRAASLLRPGALPSGIYEEIMDGLEPAFLENFMGYGKRRVRFLGHGVGLVIDETPVIARGFDEPLQEGMAIALEPKKGIRGVGMVGIENTFVVTPGGGRCITGRNRGLIPVF